MQNTYTHMDVISHIKPYYAREDALNLRNEKKKKKNFKL